MQQIPESGDNEVRNTCNNDYDRKLFQCLTLLVVISLQSRLGLSEDSITTDSGDSQLEKLSFLLLVFSTGCVP